MGTLNQVLNMSENMEDLKQVLLPMDLELVSSTTLLEEINQKFGKELAEDFMNLILKKGTVKHRELLMEFFKTKKDLISRQCLAKLEKQEQ